MPIKKWLVQYTIALPIVFAVLALVQYWKGRSLEYAVEFGVLWAFISIAVYAITRLYYFRKSINCSICNDLPADKQRTDDK